MVEIKRIIINLTFLLPGFAGYCQPPIRGAFQSGLIVTKSNDTIMCLVPITSYFGRRVSIKKSVDEDEVTMRIDNIKFLATATNVYENITFKKNGRNIDKLMWLEIEGKMNLYLELIENLSTTREVIRGGPLKWQHIYANASTTYVIRKQGQTFFIGEKNFSDSIKPLIADIPELLEKVDNNVYKYENIEELIKEYNRIALIEN